MRSTRQLTVAALALLPGALLAQPVTYAERLGWAAGERVLILHVDDAGMSHDSNLGTIRAIRDGVANSASVMMPCSWVPEFVDFLKAPPGVDAGLHLTLTSEWEHYRWGPLAGRDAVPGLVDPQACLWRSVEDVVRHASPDEVEAEIRSQIRRAREMGFEPTHLDSHMGTLFASEAFLERYVAVGVETGIPVMIPGGHLTLLKRQYRQEAIERLRRAGEWHGQEVELPPMVGRAAAVGRRVWEAGLPVLDDLHNTSYGWRLDEGVEATDDALRELKVERFTAAFRELRPGVTMMITHATDTGPRFDRISGSGPTRRGDLLALLDPRLARVLDEEGIVLTTWRELAERRRGAAP